jgi:GrpB-like predicted nucleotidyltransferase (UPF0157 family)
VNEITGSVIIFLLLVEITRAYDMKKIIEVVPYNLQWPDMFASEAKLIKQALGNNFITIHHIGSNSTRLKRKTHYRHTSCG